MKTLTTILAGLALSAALTLPVRAEQIDGCTTINAMNEVLVRGQKQRRKGAGLVLTIGTDPVQKESTLAAELLIGPGGTWSIILTEINEQRTCLVLSGIAWRELR